MNTDHLAWELEPNFFTEALNVDFNDASANKTRGYSTVQAAGPDSTWMQLFDDGTAKQLVYSTQTDLYLLQAGAWLKVGGPYTASEEWQSCAFGIHCIFNNGVEVPQSKAPGANFIDLPNWPATWTCRLIRPYKSFLVAAQVFDGGIKQSNTIFWSDTTPANELPPNWTPGAPSLAGFITLPGDGGEVVEMVPLGDSLLVYTQAAIYALTFTGNADAPMTLRKLPIAYGAAGRECVVEFQNRHFVVGLNKVYVHDTVTSLPVAEDRIENRFYSEVNDVTKTRVVQNTRTTELIVYYSAQDRYAAEKAVIWNATDDNWTFRSLPDVKCISYAFTPTEGVAWPDMIPWNQEARRWNELSQKAEGFDLFYLNDSAFMKALTTTTADGTPINAFIERLGWDLDSLMQQPTNTRKMIRSIYPQVQGSGELCCYVGFSNAPAGEVQWKDCVKIQLEQTPKRYKLDAIGHARYLSYRFEHNDVGSFRISGMELDLQPSYAR